MRVIIWQVRVAELPSESEQLAIRDLNPDVVVLPEYFSIPHGYTTQMFGDIADRHDEWFTYLEKMSITLNCVLVGGSLVYRDEDDKLYNTSHVFDRGKLLLSYRKVHLYNVEYGLSAGEKFLVCDAPRRDGTTFKLSVLICADVLHDGTFEELQKLGAELICIPTASPYRPEDPPEEKAKRDREIYVRGASVTNALICKACCVGELMGMRVQGRSLVASSDGVLKRVAIEDEHNVCTIVHDC